MRFQNPSAPEYSCLPNQPPSTKSRVACEIVTRWFGVSDLFAGILSNRGVAGSGDGEQ